MLFFVSQWELVTIMTQTEWFETLKTDIGVSQVVIGGDTCGVSETVSLLFAFLSRLIFLEQQSVPSPPSKLIVAF